MKWHIGEPPVNTRILARITHPDYSTSPFYYIVVRDRHNPDEVVEAGGENYWSFNINCVQAWVTEEELETDFKINFEF